MNVKKSTDRLGLFLSVEELADFLRISEALVYKLSSQKKIKKYKIGSRLLFKADDVLEYLEAIGVESITQSAKKSAAKAKEQREQKNNNSNGREK